MPFVLVRDHACLVTKSHSKPVLVKPLSHPRLYRASAGLVVLDMALALGKVFCLGHVSFFNCYKGDKIVRKKLMYLWENYFFPWSSGLQAEIANMCPDFQCLISVSSTYTQIILHSLMTLQCWRAATPSKQPTWSVLFPAVTLCDICVSIETEWVTHTQWEGQKQH